MKRKANGTKLSHGALYLMPILLLAVDYLAILVAQWIAIYVRQHIGMLSQYAVMPKIPPLYFYFLVPIVFLIFLYNRQTYIVRAPFWEIIEKVFHAVSCGVVVCITMMYFGHIAGGVSRIYIVLLGITAFISLCVFRYLFRKLLLNANILLEPILIIGAGKTAELIVKEMDNGAGLGVKVVGFIDDDPVSDILPKKYPILGKFTDIEKVIKKTGVQTVVIAVPGLCKKRLLNLISRVQPIVRNLSFVPDLIGAPVGDVELQRLYNARLMMIRVKNNMVRKHNRCIKRIFDLVLSVLGLILIIPISIIIMFLIYMDSSGPVIFAHQRIGKNDREFTCYKFRTMHKNADVILQQYLQKNPAVAKEWKIYRKIRGYDPRVTNIGKWLRKYSFDELPQIINVIKGEMSITGPRPYLPSEREKMGIYLNIIKKSLPGITGLWQVSGRNEVSFTDRLLMDTWYIQNWSIWIDIVLIYKTIFVVLYKKGAY